MIAREFKFRHANEIAGLFVLLAVALLVLGVIFAGRSQGWFAPRITVRILFDTTEGTFGLQEDAPVLVRNTTAGRVVSLEPTEEGQIRGILRIREQFRRFLTADGRARVKRKFGVAGDAYVELLPGTGAMLADGDVLPVVKDEELMEMAQRVLEEVQDGVMPVVAHVETILSNTASIMRKVETGQGVAGAVISDAALRDHVKAVVAHADGTSREAEGMLIELSGLMTNEVRQVLAQTVLLQRELKRTVAESRRVVEAFQRHWLIRRYVESDRATLPLVPGAAVWEVDEALVGELDERLETARRADEADALVHATYNRANVALSVGNPQEAEALLWEGLLAARRLAGGPPLALLLLQAELNRRSGSRDQALSAARAVRDAAEQEGRKGRPVLLQAQILLTALALDEGRADAARLHARNARRILQKMDPDTVLSAGLLGQEARLAFAEGQLEPAAQLYLAQADALRAHAAEALMARALRRAGDLFRNAGQDERAASAYVRAATSLLAQGDQQRGLNVLALAETAAADSEDPVWLHRVQTMRSTLAP